MRKRYRASMQDILPSQAFLSHLEREMTLELRRKRQSPIMPRVMIATAATAAVILISLGCVRLLRPHPDIVPQPPVTSPVQQATASAAPTAASTAAPTATSTVTPESTLPPDDVRLELEMSEKDFAYRSISLSRFAASDLLMFENHLVGTNNSSVLEIYESNDPNSRLLTTLLPGTAHWPVSTGENGMEPLAGENDIKSGYAQRTVWLDEERNVLRDGYIITRHAGGPAREVAENLVERINLPGRVKSGEVALRYGRSQDAPTVAILADRQLLALGWRVGNWIYASTEPYAMGDVESATGWIHITQVVGLHWRTSVRSVELLGDQVNVREKPDGKVITTLPRDYTDIMYQNVTLPGKKGDWHLVSFNTGASKGKFATTNTGYISADYAKLFTFTLDSELDMSNVVSATLTYDDNIPFRGTPQTIEDDRLTRLLDRLNGAISFSVYEEVCGEGHGTLTLNHADGSQTVLPISADGCPYIRHGDVKYDLRTAQERADAYLNEGGIDLTEIFATTFDEVKY